MCNDSECFLKCGKIQTAIFRLVDMGFKSVFSDTHCRYTGPKGFNQIGGHGFQQCVLRYSL